MKALCHPGILSTAKWCRTTVQFTSTKSDMCCRPSSRPLAGFPRNTRLLLLGSTVSVIGLGAPTDCHGVPPFAVPDARTKPRRRCRWNAVCGHVSAHGGWTHLPSGEDRRKRNGWLAGRRWVRTEPVVGGSRHPVAVLRMAARHEMPFRPPRSDLTARDAGRTYRAVCGGRDAVRA